jgi:hypothetical protein
VLQSPPCVAPCVAGVVVLPAVVCKCVCVHGPLPLTLAPPVAVSRPAPPCVYCVVWVVPPPPLAPPPLPPRPPNSQPFTRVPHTWEAVAPPGPPTALPTPVRTPPGSAGSTRPGSRPRLPPPMHAALAASGLVYAPDTTLSLSGAAGAGASGAAEGSRADDEAWASKTPLARFGVMDVLGQARAMVQSLQSAMAPVRVRGHAVLPGHALGKDLCSVGMRWDTTCTVVAPGTVPG